MYVRKKHISLHTYFFVTHTHILFIVLNALLNHISLVFSTKNLKIKVNKAIFDKLQQQVRGNLKQNILFFKVILYLKEQYKFFNLHYYNINLYVLSISHLKQQKQQKCESIFSFVIHIHIYMFTYIQN